MKTNQGKYIALHHTSSYNTGASQLNAVDRYHKSKWDMKSTKGWYVGYHYFMDAQGKITNTRDINEESIANMGYNCDRQETCTAISICMQGDFNTQHPTDAQTKAFKEFVHNMQQRFDGIKVVGHRDLQAHRTCPGKNIKKRYLDNASKGLNEDQLKADEIATKMLLITRLKELYARLSALLSLRKWV
ncbi:MAG: N-acetylmuramoyl-L-alanine amidase [Gammaproteobacteria bacterium]|nr:N-acetylmuramoyl-L-alanine amidase [Gammaproteobacteria bacterium]